MNIFLSNEVSLLIDPLVLLAITHKNSYDNDSINKRLVDTEGEIVAYNDYSTIGYVSKQILMKIGKEGFKIDIS